MTKRQMSFADWEMLRQGQTLASILQAISDFLDNNSTIVDALQRDLRRGLKSGTGRNGLTAQQVLRALILKCVKNWDLRELRERIADGISLRQFTDFYSGTVPKHQRFNHAFNRLTPEAVKIVNDLVVKAAVELGLEDGSKLRTDTTMVQTNIHHPTDSTLLWAIPTSRASADCQIFLAHMSSMSGKETKMRMHRNQLQYL